MASSGMRIVRRVVSPCDSPSLGSGSESESESESDMLSEEESSVRSLSQPGIGLTPRSAISPSLLFLPGEEDGGGRSLSSSTSDRSSDMVVTSFSFMEVIVDSELVLGRRERSISEEANLRCFQSPMLHLTQRRIRVCAGNFSLHPGIWQWRFMLLVSHGACCSK